MCDDDDLVGFNPNQRLDSQELADGYLRWCAYQLGLHQQRERTLGTATRGCAFVWVLAAAQMRVDDDIATAEMQRDVLALFNMGRRLERRPSVVDHRAVSLAMMLADAWEPVGRYAPALLGSLRCGIGAALICRSHPLNESHDLPGEHAWALIDAGIGLLEGIADADYPDYAVQPCQRVKDRMGWQRARGIAGQLGGEPPSPN